MSLPSDKLDVECNDGNDSENDSFSSALCEMYNDVLNHAIIPEDDEVTFSRNQFVDISPGTERDTFYSVGGSEANSLVPLRKLSIASRKGVSLCSSDMLSTSSADDDDLSFITEPEFEEKNNSLPINCGDSNDGDKKITNACASQEMAESVNAEFFDSQNRSNDSNDLGFDLSDLDAALIPPSALKPCLDRTDTSRYTSVSSISSASF